MSDKREAATLGYDVPAGMEQHYRNRQREPPQLLRSRWTLLLGGFRARTVAVTTTERHTMTTEPFTSTFGAIPRPEEPPRRPDPPPPAAQYGGFGDMTWSPDPTSYPPPAPPQYAAFSPSGPTATASVINNIRIGGAGYHRGCNHLLHGTLTLATCGLWAPVWFLAWVTARQR